MQVPAALQASSSSHKDDSFDFERKVMQEDASKSIESFMQKPEVRMWPTAHAADTLTSSSTACDRVGVVSRLQRAA